MKRALEKADAVLSIKAVFDLFIVNKKAHGLAKKTIDCYIEAHRRFIRDLKLNEQEQIETIDENMILQWIVALQSQNLSPSTVNHYVRCIRAFLYWTMERGYIERFKICPIKAQEEKIKFFTDDELKALIKKPQKTASFFEWRMYTVICFILATSARASTVINIKISDLDFERQEITYAHLKNKKLAIVPMSNELKRILIEWLTMWKRTQNDGWLFCNGSEGQLTVNALENAMRKYCKKRGVHSKKNLHALRHSYARLWIKNGGGEFALQQMLTHSDLTMTKRYVRLFSDDLKVNYEQFSPLDNMKQAGNHTLTVHR